MAGGNLGFGEAHMDNAWDAAEHYGVEAVGVTISEEE